MKNGLLTILWVLVLPLFSDAQVRDTMLEVQFNVFDANGQQTRSFMKVRDSSGKMQKILFARGEEAPWTSTVFDYDSSGRIVRELDLLPDGTPGDSTVFHYYKDGSTKTAWLALDENSYVVQQTHSDLGGNSVLKVTHLRQDDLEQVDTFFFNRYGRDSLSRHYLMKDGAYQFDGQVVNSWSPEGWLTEVRVHDKSGLKSVLRHTYDSAGLILSSVFFLTADSTTKVWSHYTYFKDGDTLIRTTISDGFTGSIVERFDSANRLLEQRGEDSDGKLRNLLSNVYNEQGYLTSSKKVHLPNPSLTTTTIYTYAAYPK